MTNDERDAEVGMLKLAAARDAETIRILTDPDPVQLEVLGFLNLLARGILPPNYHLQAADLVNKLAEQPATLAALGLSPALLPGVQS